MVLGALVPKNGQAAAAPVKHQAGRHAVHEAKRAEDSPIGVAQEATYQPGLQRRWARQLLQGSPRVARPPRRPLSRCMVRRRPAGGRGHDTVRFPLSKPLYIYTAAPLCSALCSPAKHGFFRNRPATRPPVEFEHRDNVLCGRRTEEAQIAALVTLRSPVLNSTICTIYYELNYNTNVALSKILSDNQSKFKSKYIVKIAISINFTNCNESNQTQIQ